MWLGAIKISRKLLKICKDLRKKIKNYKRNYEQDLDNMSKKES